MPEMNYEFEQFFNKEGFNKSLGHFQAVSGLLDDLQDRYNLADILNTFVEEKEILQHQLSPIMYALLADKYAYESKSYNMQTTLSDFSGFITEAKKWKAVDVVIAYHHPELGFTLINPKNAEHWDVVQSIKKNELIIVYAGAFDNPVDKKVARAAIKACISLFEGKKTKIPEALLKGKFSFKPFVTEDDEDDHEEETASKPSTRTAPDRPKSKRTEISASSGESSSGEDEDNAEQAAAPAAAPPKPAAPAVPSGARKMTPMYSVPVTNELFHNGNVEAWKKVIESYELKYPGCEVNVFYEGEKIHDLNTLFKWGKVKHGSSILFAILGTDIGGVAKLQRYLRQGASHQFEAFLKFPVNTVLKLF